MLLGAKLLKEKAVNSLQLAEQVWVDYAARFRGEAHDRS